MADACQIPKLVKGRTLVHCNAGWVVDGKAAGHFGGWGQWYQS